MEQENMLDEYMAYGETAYANKQFEEALKWFKKALLEDENNVYALSRAGAVCVPMGKFNESKEYFMKAVDVDKTNGDNYFNLANTYFFEKDYSRALELYAEAELKGCSENVKPKLYYQLALLCTVKKDAKSALLNYQKYEELNKSGENANDTKILFEKVKLYLLLGELKKAENCIIQLKSISPSDYNVYKLYFNLLLLSKSYDKANEIIDEAFKYAALTEEDNVNLQFTRVVLYISIAEDYKEKSEEYYQKSLDILNTLKTLPEITDKQYININITSAEIYLKLGKFDNAITSVEDVKFKYKSAIDDLENQANSIYPEEVDTEEMLSNDLREMEEKIYNGEIDDGYGEFAEITYDENGEEVRVYPDGMFNNDEVLNYEQSQNVDIPSIVENKEDSDDNDNYSEINSKLDFIMLSCYISKEDYEKSLEYSTRLKNSDNVYYSYFGIYTEAFAVKKLSEIAKKFDKAESERKYSEAIAFFRAKMLENPSDKFAVVFRTRMYAEMGKFAKAEEIATLLTTDEKAALKEYIELCRKGI